MDRKTERMEKGAVGIAYSKIKGEGVNLMNDKVFGGRTRLKKELPGIRAKKKLMIEGEMIGAAHKSKASVFSISGTAVPMKA